MLDIRRGLRPSEQGYPRRIHPGGMMDISRGPAERSPRIRIMKLNRALKRRWRNPMSSTHLSLHVHIVFSTKHRFPFIRDEWRERLYAFLGGAIRTAGAIPESVGGTNDHVHLLIGIRATHCVADIARDIKHASSKWIHENIGNKKFGWQDGYGAFTISASQLDAVKEYIRNQAEHHRKRTFEEEYVDFLKRAQVDYEEKYLW
jgi:putative transposase